MRRFVYWLFPLTAAAVALFIAVFLFRINLPASVPEEPQKGEEDPFSVPATIAQSWIGRFTPDEDKGYLYPVNEVHLELDSGGASRLPAYRLEAPVKDSYELFCLKQELANSGLSYFMHTEGETMTLLVDSDDRNRLESLVTKLKTYQIPATLSPYTEEQ